MSVKYYSVMTTNTINGQAIVADGTPSKTYGGGKERTCAGADCSTFLSKYNAKDFCASCWDAIPVEARPYEYADGF